MEVLANVTVSHKAIKAGTEVKVVAQAMGVFSDTLYEVAQTSAISNISITSSISLEDGKLPLVLKNTGTTTIPMGMITLDIYQPIEELDSTTDLSTNQGVL